MCGNSLKKAIRNNNLENIKKIINKNPDKINEKFKRGNTPLLVACDIETGFIEKENHEMVSKRYEIIKFLLDSGANPNTQNDDGETPLQTLLEFYEDKKKLTDSLIKMIDILIKKGADVNLKNYHGFLPIEYFFESYINSLFGLHDTPSEEEQQIIFTIIELILKNGFKIDQMGGTFDPLKLSFTYDLKKEIEEKDDEIKKLKKRIEELTYQPGNPGYYEANKNYNDLVSEEKK